MNILIIGQNSKIANVFSRFATVIMVVDKNIESYRKYDENSNFIIIESMTNIRSTCSILKRAKELQSWIHQYTPDVVYSNDKYSMIAARIATLFKRNRPLLISTSHSSYSWTNPKRVHQFAYAVKWCTDGYVALASFVYQYLLDNGLNKQRLLLQPNTIEYDTFPLKESYAISGIPKLIYTAVIYPQKGQLLLVEAVKILLDREIMLHVDLVGDFVDEEYKNQINAYIQRYNLSEYISFTGRIDNSMLRKKLSLYDIYVSPSFIEMSPFNLLEAKAVGLPIIACKTGGIPDIISDTNDGILIPPRDAKSLADAIELLLNNDEMRKHLGSAARHNISSVQAPDAVAKRLQDFFYRLNS